MDIDQPLRELGTIDATALRDAILELGDVAWQEDKFRQESFYVHDQTRSIVMITLDDSNWPYGPISRGPGWKRIADVALPVMQEIITKHYPEGGEVLRAVAASLTAGANIKAHSDIHQSFHCAHRIHVPITTNPKVWFTINGRPFQFKLGQAYEINNQKQHSVVNRGAEDRITFIFDYIPPGPLAYDLGKGKERPESLSTKPDDVAFRIPPEESAGAN
jgi:hypothetical protein